MQLTTHILGSGLAGKAIAKALAILKAMDTALNLGETAFLPRDCRLSDYAAVQKKVLCIANPSALHTPRMIEAMEAGYELVVCEKPTSTSLAQLEAVKNLPGQVAVLHVYRQMWGVQELNALIGAGKLGRVVAIEGRLWQPSRVARYSSVPYTATPREWVGDSALAGDYGVILGLGTHWLDAALFLANEDARISGHHIGFLRDGSGGDDVYLNLQLQSEGGIFISGSISNMVHAARNDFELAVLGEEGSAQWSLMQPDQIIVGQGRDRSYHYRRTTAIGSGHPAFHGIGWLEGYVEILRQSYRHFLGLPYQPYPTLSQSNRVVDLLLNLAG